MANSVLFSRVAWQSFRQSVVLALSRSKSTSAAHQRDMPHDFRDMDPRKVSKLRLKPLEAFQPQSIKNSCGRMSDKHLKDKWDEEEMNDAVRDHVMMTWSSNAPRVALPRIVKAEGVYLYDDQGKKYMDLTSQAVCANMGYSVSEEVKSAIINQIESVPFMYSGMGITEIRARMSSLMADIAPGDINGFLFPCGGSEANEGAIRLARRYTNRPKIMSALRSYHGGTTGPLAASGDFRSRMIEQQNGFVKVFTPHALQFSTGAQGGEVSAQALRMLEEQIIGEGPDSIAAIMLETVVGSNGVFLHPEGYLGGVRSLCDRYGILLILDEVMCGFWRTGPLFAFEHSPGVVPDILTSAKGLTGSILPLGMIGIRQHIKDYFENVPLGWGATYANHPVLLACAYEIVRNNVVTRLEDRVRKVEQIMLEKVGDLVERHPSVQSGRVIGAFGCLDLVDAQGNPLGRPGEDPTREGLIAKQSMKSHGLVGFFRPPLMHICPPLVITEDELIEMFSRVDAVLLDLDNALDGK